MEINITPPTKHVRLQPPRFSLSPAATFLLPFLLVVGALLLTITVSVALANTLIIFVTLTAMGLWLCDRTRVDLGDAQLKRLSTFWLLKVTITLFLLYAGWIPELDSSSVSWGYDPQRYYQDAWDLIENGWNPSVGANYQGIIYYYGVIFYLFGHNPVIPALINAFVTLLGTLLLIRSVYSFVPDRTAKDWTIAGLLLVPEVLWYDVMTSRETLLAVLIFFAIFPIGRYLAEKKETSLASAVLVSEMALFAIVTVRTPMVMPVALSIGVMFALIRSREKLGPLVKVMLLGLAIGALAVGPHIQGLIGGYDLDYSNYVESLQSIEANYAANEIWSVRSIGLLIAPENTWQALLYLPARMVLYLIAPLPNVAVSVTELISGSWTAWQNLMVVPTSVMMLMGLPFALAGAAQAWRLRRLQPAPLVLHITFWITFAGVAGGNFTIIDRYRLMFTLLLFACVWFGYTRCSRGEVKHWARAWFGFLSTFTFVYVIYKFY